MSEHKQERMQRTGSVPKPVTPDTPAGDNTLRVAKKIKPAEVPKRRVAMLMVKPGDFMFLFTKGLRFQKNFKVIEGVPDDAEVIAVAPDSMRNGIMLVIQSQEFDEVPMTVLPPIIPVDIDLDGIKQATKKKVTAEQRKKDRKKGRK